MRSQTLFAPIAQWLVCVVRRVDFFIIIYSIHKRDKRHLGSDAARPPTTERAANADRGYCRPSAEKQHHGTRHGTKRATDILGATEPGPK